MSFLSSLASSVANGFSTVFCCCSRRRPAREELLKDREVEHFQAETTTLAAAGRIADVLRANKSTGTLAKLKNTAKVQPLVVDVLEPLASSTVVSPVVKCTVANLIASPQERIITEALIIAVVAGAFFSHQLKKDTRLMALVAFAMIALPILIDKIFIEPPAETHIRRMNDTSRIMMCASKTINNYQTLSRLAAAGLFAVVAYQKFNDSIKSPIDTNFLQTTAICVASLLMMPRVTSKLIQDLEAVTLRPLRDCARASVLVSNLVKSPAETLALSAKMDREATFLKLPPRVREAYLAVLTSAKTLQKQEESLSKPLERLTRDISLKTQQITLEQRKGLDDYKSSFHFIARLLTTVTEDTLRERQQSAIAALTQQRTSLQQEMAALEGQLRACADLFRANQATLNTLITNSGAEEEIRPLINQLTQTCLSHHLFVKRCQSLSKAATITKYTGAALGAGAVATSIGVAAFSSNQRHRQLAAQALDRGAHAATKVLNIKDAVDSKLYQIQSSSKDIIAGAGSKVLSPVISKLALNALAPIAIQSLATYFNPSLAEASLQFSHILGWFGFISLISQLHSAYSEQNMRLSTHGSARYAAQRAVDFLVATPQNPLEVLCAQPSHRKESAAHAHIALRKLYKSALIAEGSLASRATIALVALRDLGFHTRVLDREKANKILAIKPIMDDLLTPIDRFMAASDSQTGQTYAGAIASAARSGISLTARSGRIGFVPEMALLGATWVIQAPLAGSEILIRRMLPARPAALPARALQIQLETPESGLRSAIAASWRQTNITRGQLAQRSALVEFQNHAAEKKATE